MTIERIAVVGGTGPHGYGLAQRLAMAGCSVVIGSRDGARAEAVAKTIREATGNARVGGAENRHAVAGVDAAILAIPADALADMLDSCLPVVLPDDIGRPDCAFSMDKSAPLRRLFKTAACACLHPRNPQTADFKRLQR